MSRLARLEREAIVKRLLTKKELSGKTYDEIAGEVGLTNAMVGQIFHRQAQLKQASVDKMKRAVPLLNNEDIFEMCKVPFRSFDPEILQEPTIYRLNEVCMHYGETIKEIINEKCGDGIMSAIDFNLNVDLVKGSKGENRIILRMDGKFLPYSEQNTAEEE
eukprot:Plantae.Rhodophyta-Purpureofilum_apyrenoidigerum.ctg21017.p2 GENE.Plantae.Rhodophyta-Purpureofilum_apyrenoidigerum.ctg21017~~Plantae.Rhodophyta-Purpureofilum_apyrenoidigerum.ctg21017.p2  ORF type:complete len:161 (-),score=47.19 Plantae.Rhodophyta-Purpureofilum_apyrenoidigerum.ctg21017:990-1472(-)